MGTNPVVKAGPDPIICSAKKHVPRHTEPSQLRVDAENIPGLSHQNPAGPACEMPNRALAVPLSINNSNNTQAEQTKSVWRGGNLYISRPLMAREEACQGEARASCSLSKGEPRVTPVQGAHNSILQQPQTRQGLGSAQGCSRRTGDTLLTVQVQGPSRRQSQRHTHLQYSPGRGQQPKAALK